MASKTIPKVMDIVYSGRLHVVAVFFRVASLSECYFCF